ncbi:hypothetical protein HG535_0A09170 [Zygotorulaspora mrakii]|uniref:Flo11 domain-containing protein n=1 Tax=Zygotorulaspora mrakii TaxID=42260 RepID=A0A7H9AXT5_ZYGMR|nr:uncharacterized protein HG535_0A09170 [Zygotorulaspora mrakii]QLG70967.1 hypothetical protein HG535_0A09170 [Zygotorulaspora mrakii]
MIFFHLLEFFVFLLCGQQILATDQHHSSTTNLALNRHGGGSGGVSCHTFEPLCPDLNFHWHEKNENIMEYTMNVLSVKWMAGNTYQITINVKGAQKIDLKYLWSLKIIGINGPRGTHQLYGFNENVFLIQDPTDYTATFEVYGHPAVEDPCRVLMPSFQIQYEYHNRHGGWKWGKQTFDLMTGCNADNNGNSNADFPLSYWTNKCASCEPTSSSSSVPSSSVPSSSVPSSSIPSSSIPSSSIPSSSVPTSSIPTSSIPSSSVPSSSIPSSSIPTSSVPTSSIPSSSVPTSSVPTSSIPTSSIPTSSIPSSSIPSSSVPTSSIPTSSIPSSSVPSSSIPSSSIPSSSIPSSSVPSSSIPSSSVPTSSIPTSSIPSSSIPSSSVPSSSIPSSSFPGPSLATRSYTLTITSTENGIVTEYTTICPVTLSVKSTLAKVTTLENAEMVTYTTKYPVTVLSSTGTIVATQSTAQVTSLTTTSMTQKSQATSYTAFPVYSENSKFPFITSISTAESSLAETESKQTRITSTFAGSAASRTSSETILVAPVSSSAVSLSNNALSTSVILSAYEGFANSLSVGFGGFICFLTFMII